MAAAMPSKGVSPSSTRASRHSRMKPTTKAAKKVVTHWIKMAALSPMPAYILPVSLKREREREGGGHSYYPALPLSSPHVSEVISILLP